jgi:hypothetical protein
MFICIDTVLDLLTMVDNYLEINEFPNEQNHQELLQFQDMLINASAEAGTIEITFNS